MQVNNSNSLFYQRQVNTAQTVNSGKVSESAVKSTSTQVNAARAEDTQQAERPTVQQLMKSIDPENMTRKESLALADALMREGQAELSMAFFSQGLVLVNQGGELVPADDGHPAMNERFNMFEAFAGQIAFNRSQGEEVAHLENAIDFLQKMKVPSETPEINTFA